MDIRSQKQARASATRWLLVWLAFVFVMLSARTYAGTVTYVYTDAQGTPLAKADASGNVIATFDYAPYGAQALGTPPSGPGYTGHVNDPDTGLVYMQARYYDPVVGRFLSVDPVKVSPGNAFDFNRYAYANNNPNVYVDLDGRLPTCAPHCTRAEADAYVAGQARGLVLLFGGTAVAGGSAAALAATGISAGTSAVLRSALRYAASDKGRTLACLAISLACKNPAAIKPGESDVSNGSPLMNVVRALERRRDISSKAQMETKDALIKQIQLDKAGPGQANQGGQAGSQEGFRGFYIVNGRIDSAKLARRLEHVDRPEK